MAASSRLHIFMDSGSILPVYNLHIIEVWMKITDIFKSKKQTFSFEFFPPKTEKGMSNLLKTIGELKKFHPDYVSITYGAMGSTQEKTISIADQIQNKIGLTAMSHLTCVGASAEQIGEILDTLQNLGIKNIMALRGDPPQGEDKFVYTPGGYNHATNLIQSIKGNGNFCIGAAGYPEGHVEARDLGSDLKYLKMKMDMGAEFIVTQLFLDNSYFYRFRDRAQDKGINLRLIPGVMPVTNWHQITKFSDMCGCTIPINLKEKLFPVRDDKEEISRIGIEYAINQCRDLLKNGAPGLHFYTLNKSKATRQIFEALVSENLISLD